VKNSEKDLFKTAKLASKLSKRSDITGLIEKDRDEAELRNKLVSKLKEKEIEKMKGCEEKLRDKSFYSNGDESREDISDEDPIKEEKEDRILSSEDEEEDLDEVSEEDLRLTSSTDNDEEGNGTEDKKKKKKKKKKEKKKKEKEREREKDEKREKRKKRKELEDFTTLAQRIANRDKRSRSPKDKDKERHQSRRESSPPKEKKPLAAEWQDRPRKRTREDEVRDRQVQRLAMVRASQLASRQEAKRKEQALDEVYDNMVNGGGGYRKLKRGEHYEDVQNTVLANEIRIKERREKYERAEERNGGHRGGDSRDQSRNYQKFQAHQHGQRRGGREDRREDRQYHPYRR